MSSSAHPNCWLCHNSPAVCWILILCFIMWKLTKTVCANSDQTCITGCLKECCQHLNSCLLLVTLTTVFCQLLLVLMWVVLMLSSFWSVWGKTTQLWLSGSRALLTLHYLICRTGMGAGEWADVLYSVHNHWWGLGISLYWCLCSKF